MLIFAFSPLEAQQGRWELVREDFTGQIATDPRDPNIIYVSPGRSPEFGLHKSVDGGQTWVNYQQGYEGLGDISGILVDPNNPQRIWVYGGPFRGIARSEDGGVTAVAADTSIVADHHGYSVAAFAYDTKRGILYAGDHTTFTGIYRSFDHGRRWQLIQSITRGLMFTPMFFLVEEDSGWIYSGTGGNVSGIWRSKDMGETWLPLDSTVLSARFIRFLAKVPESNTMFAAGLQGEIFKSNNLGENWNLVSDLTPGSDVLAGGLLISPIDTNYLFVGDNVEGSAMGGFYLSRDGGKQWQAHNTGLPQAATGQAVWSLAQTQNGSHLYLSLRSSINSVFKISQSLLTSVKETSGSEEFIHISLLQCFPNPFNDMTKIEFAIAGRKLVSLRIYAVTGQLVARLFDGLLEAGTHTQVWNGNMTEGGEMPSGVYFCRLEAGGDVMYRKLVLIR